MKNIFIFTLFILFLINKNTVILNILTTYNMWLTTLLPIIFPTLIITDLLLTTDLPNKINKLPLKLYSKIFKCKQIGLYIFIMSIIGATPTNAKILNNLYKNNSIDINDINKILTSCIFFNPILIIKLCNLKILIIMYISNILTGIILRNSIKISNVNKLPIINIKYDINESISSNISIIFNILGTVLFFSVISTLISTNNLYINILTNGLLEITNGLNLIHLIDNLYIKDIISMILISFSSISIFIQIKSIINNIDTYYYFKSRIITLIISVILIIII